MTGQQVQPVIEATFALRKAASACCGAKLDRGDGRWWCLECGNPCERVLAEATEVNARG